MQSKFINLSRQKHFQQIRMVRNYMSLSVHSMHTATVQLKGNVALARKFCRVNSITRRVSCTEVLAACEVTSTRSKLECMI